MAQTNKNTKILSKLMENYENKRRGSSVSGGITDTCMYTREALIGTSNQKPIASGFKSQMLSVNKQQTSCSKLPRVKSSANSPVHNSTKAFNIEDTVIYKPIIANKENIQIQIKPTYQKEVKKNKSRGCFLFKCFA
jgi:hypothetical protein